jgi:DNA polymerase-3 subunit delta'
MPIPFAGNPRALAAGQRSLAGERPPRSYLFVGPERVGKATLALQLAQALNCEQTVGARRASPLRPDSDGGPEPSASDPSPCGECRACTRIAAGIHSDVHTISFDIADDGRTLTEISVDQVRELERSVALAPYEGRTRVVIIDPADAMSISAQNAFLKTLEEPPPHAAFVLIATNEDALLPTIHSRCRRVEFRLAPASDVEAALTSEGVEPERAALLARLARGRVGWALEAARDETLLERRSERLKQARAIAEMSVAERMHLAETLNDQFKLQRSHVFDRLDEWLGWWRDVMLLQSGAPDGVANVDALDTLRETASRHHRDEVLRFVQAIVAAKEHLHANVQARIALESLLLEAPLPARTSVPS